MTTEEVPNTNRDQSLRELHTPWGLALIVEEASHEGRHYRAAIQLVEFEEGTTPTIRFCEYDLDGKLLPKPLSVGYDDILALREALSKTPRLRAFLQRLCEEA